MLEGTLLFMQEYGKAKNMLVQFDKSSEKGRNWNSYIELIGELIQGKQKGKVTLDTFQQNHRISKTWPKIKLP